MAFNNAMIMPSTDNSTVADGVALERAESRTRSPGMRDILGIRSGYRPRVIVKLQNGNQPDVPTGVRGGRRTRYRARARIKRSC